jgi:RNA polymerase primary sigma factor
MVHQQSQFDIHARDGSELPLPPRHIAHDELKRPGIGKRLFSAHLDPASPKLTPEQELVLFKRMHYAAYRLSKIWKQRRTLTTEEQSDYLNWYTCYVRIRDRVVNANLGLVFKLLSKCRFTNVDFDELRSEGLMALLRATDTYNPWSGFRFSTYACNAILRAFARAAEVQARRQRRLGGSLDTMNEPTAWPDQTHSEQEALMVERLSVVLREQQAGLNDHERFVLHHRFGRPSDESPATLKRVGEMLNISKERVRQIQASALAKLRRALLGDPVLQ